MSDMERRSIPTRYRGVRYRSKLEADWAKTFDVLGVRHHYEKEGVYFGDQFYLPDFYLPASRQYVEVKGLWEPDDCRKIQALLKHIAPRPLTGEWCSDIPIIACMPEGAFFGWERGLGLDLPFHQFVSLGPNRAAREIELFRCEKCRQWWFADASESWHCQCCGHYDGNHSYSDVYQNRICPFPLAERAA